MSRIQNRRAFFRRGLSPLYLPHYDSLCEILGDKWQPYQGLRSFEKQDTMYARGRTTVPTGKQYIVTNAKGGESAHNYGCASDWTIFMEGVPLWLSAGDPRWEEYENACEKVGLRWGGSFVSLVDCYHNELPISVPWKRVAKVLESSGQEGMVKFIKDKSGFGSSGEEPGDDFDEV